MNESDLENELQKLRPSAPPAALEEAIARELRGLVVTAPFPTPRAHQLSGTISRSKPRLFSRLFSGLCWAGAGAAAALLASASLDRLHTPAAPGAQPALAATVSENVFEETESSRHLLDTEDTGLIYTEEQEPTRVVRYSSLERYVWANPATGARVEVEVPREDLVLVPVSYQ